VYVCHCKFDIGLMSGFIGLFDTALITPCSSLLHKYISVHGQVLTGHCLVAASNGRCFPSFGFPIKNSTDRFATSNPTICLTVLLNALWLPRSSCCILLRPLMPLSVALPGPYDQVPCERRNGTAGQPSSGNGQLLLRPTTALDPFFRQSA
jgi:hypothetical protein